MKNIKIKIVALSLVMITCISFTAVQGREEELNRLSCKYAVVFDKCFEDLLTNLKDVKAIIFLPDTKLAKGKEMKLSPVVEQKDSVNLALDYVQVAPVVKSTNECATKAKLTFDNLNMIVFVEKSSLTKLSASNLNFKWENVKIGAVDLKLTNNFKFGTKLRTTFIDKTTPLLLTQVEFKI